MPIDPQPTAADSEAARIVARALDIDSWATNGGYFSDTLVAAFTRHATEREAQVIAGVIAWLKKRDSEGCRLRPTHFADAIKRSDWKGPRHAE